MVVNLFNIVAIHVRWITGRNTNEKRAAELHDEILFKHPEGGYLGDCPICGLRYRLI